MQTSIRVDGSEVIATNARLLLAVERLPQKVIRPAVEAGVEYARKYPPELPGQKYVRTGTYGRSFRITSIGRGFMISSDARRKGKRYTRYVGGLADGSGQAAIHADRWTRIRTAVLWVMSEIVRLADEEFNRAATGHFGL